MGFWNNFWNNIKKLVDKPSEENLIQPRVQKWDDIRSYNPLDIVVSKLTTIVNDEATIEIESESKLAEPLKELCKEAEAKRYEICSMMLGKGGCYVTLAHREDGNPYHRILPPEKVSVYSINAGQIYEVALEINRKMVDKTEYRLIRHHMLDTDGTLYVYYYTTDRSGNEAYLKEWAHYENEGVAFLNAHNIGVAYFKSPQNSRGIQQEFGVPLNFGCEEVEQNIIRDRKALDEEMENLKAKIFADESITREITTNEGKKYELPENIYTIKKKAGVDGSLMDSFAPGTRFHDYKNKLDASCAEYEDQIGLNRGFLTEAEKTDRATATEIRYANIKTISMMKKVQYAMFDGFKKLFTADSIMMMIPVGSWTLKVDWFNPFEDETTQYERLRLAVQEGYAEDTDLIKWLFPNLSADEIEQKKQRIANKRVVVEETTVGGV